MRIYVNRIPPEGVKNHATYDPTPMEMGRSDIHCLEPLEVDAFMTTVDRELVVDVDIRCPLQLVCARCLEEFRWVMTTEALFSYKVQPSDVVDITDDVRQEVILAYPMIPLCRPDCKGLCSTCGQNLSHEVCGHHQRPEGLGP